MIAIIFKLPALCILQQVQVVRILCPCRLDHMALLCVFIFPTYVMTHYVHLATDSIHTATIPSTQLEESRVIKVWLS